MSTDVTHHCKCVLEILIQASCANQRLTAIKLLEAWEGKGQKASRVKGQSPPNLPRESLEIILAHMLLKGYLREDYHFTAYSTISYIVKGRKSASLESGLVKLQIDLNGQKKHMKPGKACTNSDATKMVKSGTSKTPKESKEGTTKPKLVLINSEKSFFSPFQGPSSPPAHLDKCIKSTHLKNGKKPVTSVQKKRPLTVVSDSDSDLDFDDDFKISTPAVKRKKKCNVDLVESNGDIEHTEATANNIDTISIGSSDEEY